LKSRISDVAFKGIADIGFTISADRAISGQFSFISKVLREAAENAQRHH
jgi:hypothetical protein